MTSEYSPGSSGARERFTRLRRDLDEDPARFLDQDLFEHGQVRLEEREHSEYNQSNQRVVRDDDVSSPGEMIRDRIRGIDDLEVARAWRAVERNLDRTPEGGRDVVIGFLEDRIDELEATGERELPGLTPSQQRRLAAEKYFSKEEATFVDVDGEERSDQLAADERMATARADGGEEQ